MLGPWEKYGGSPQPGGLEAVPLPEKPNRPTPQTPAQAAKDNLEVELKREELAEKRRKKQTATDPRSAMLELRNVIDAAFRARELSRDGWFATGAGSGLAQKFGGTTASDVKGKLDTIGANTAFEQLQKMREASPTGGALGAITERELDLLKSTIASLDQAQSDEEFQGAMQQIANAYGRTLMKLPGGRQMMIERGWLPKSGNGGKKPPASRQQRPAARKVIDFNDLPE